MNIKFERNIGLYELKINKVVSGIHVLVLPKKTKTFPKNFFFNTIDLLQSSMYCKVFMNSVISIFICCYIAIMAIGLNRHFHAF